VVNCVVERGVSVVICVVDFDAEKHAFFLKLFFRILPGLGQDDRAVERSLDRGQVRGDWARPGDGDAREGFGDEEAIPGAELPGALGVDVEGSDGGACKFG